MRLLVVEDESLLCQQLEKGLRKEGYVVDAAEDGTTGLYYATEFDYDAAIIDLGLPEIDGISLINKFVPRAKNFPCSSLPRGETGRTRWLAWTRVRTTMWLNLFNSRKLSPDSMPCCDGLRDSPSRNSNLAA